MSADIERAGKARQDLSLSELALQAKRAETKPSLKEGGKEEGARPLSELAIEAKQGETQTKQAPPEITTKETETSIGETIKDVAASVIHTGAEFAHVATETLSHFAHATTEKVSHIAHAATSAPSEPAAPAATSAPTAPVAQAQEDQTPRKQQMEQQEEEKGKKQQKVEVITPFPAPAPEIKHRHDLPPLESHKVSGPIKNPHTPEYYERRIAELSHEPRLHYDPSRRNNQAELIMASEDDDFPAVAQTEMDRSEYLKRMVSKVDAYDAPIRDNTLPTTSVEHIRGETTTAELPSQPSRRVFATTTYLTGSQTTVIREGPSMPVSSTELPPAAASRGRTFFVETSPAAPSVPTTAGPIAAAPSTVPTTTTTITRTYEEPVTTYQTISSQPQQVQFVEEHHPGLKDRIMRVFTHRKDRYSPTAAAVPPQPTYYAQPQPIQRETLPTGATVTMVPTVPVPIQQPPVHVERRVEPEQRRFIEERPIERRIEETTVIRESVAPAAPAPMTTTTTTAPIRTEAPVVQQAAPAPAPAPQTATISNLDVRVRFVDRDEPCFMTGETIEGVILIKNRSDQALPQQGFLSLMLHGREFAIWNKEKLTARFGLQKGAGAYEKMDGFMQFADQISKVVIGNQLGVGGEASFPFRYLIPAGLPSSYNEPSHSIRGGTMFEAKIEYFLELALIGPERNLLHTEFLPITLYHVSEGRNYQPVAEAKKHSLSGGQNVFMKAFLRSADLFVGEEAEIILEIVNDSNKEVGEIEVELIKHVRFQTQSNKRPQKIKVKDYEETVCRSVIYESVQGDHNAKRLTVRMHLPTDIQPSTFGKRVMVDHFLRFSVKNGPVLNLPINLSVHPREFFTNRMMAMARDRPSLLSTSSSSMMSRASMMMGAGGISSASSTLDRPVSFQRPSAALSS